MAYQPKTDFEPVELPDGTQGKKWSNGSITRLDGTIFKPSDNAVKIVTSEDSQAMIAKRQEKRRHTIEKYVTEAVKKRVRKATGAFMSDDALGALAAKRAVVALTDEGRAGNDAAKFVFQVMDAMPEKVKETTIVHQHELSPRAIELLKEVARQRNDPDNFIEGREV